MPYMVMMYDQNAICGHTIYTLLGLVSEEAKLSALDIRIRFVPRYAPHAVYPYMVI